MASLITVSAVSKKKYPITNATTIFSYKKVGSSVVNYAISSDLNYEYSEWAALIYDVLFAAGITGMNVTFETEEYFKITGTNLESFIFKNTTLAEIFGIIKPGETLTDKNIMTNGGNAYYWGIARFVMQNSFDSAYGNKSPSHISKNKTNAILKGKTTITRYAVINNYNKNFDLDSYTWTITWMAKSKREMIQDFLDENCKDGRDAELVNIYGMYYIDFEDVYKISTEKYLFALDEQSGPKLLSNFDIDIIAVV